MRICFIYGFTGVASADTPIHKFLVPLGYPVDFFEWHWSVRDMIRRSYGPQQAPLVLIGHSFGGAEVLNILPDLVRPLTDHEKADHPDWYADAIPIGHVVCLDPVHFGPWIKFKLPDSVDGTCYYRQFHLFDGELIAGDPVDGADNHILELRHGEFITDPGVLDNIRGIIETVASEMTAQAVEDQLRRQST